MARIDFKHTGQLSHPNSNPGVVEDNMVRTWASMVQPEVKSPAMNQGIRSEHRRGGVGVDAQMSSSEKRGAGDGRRAGGEAAERVGEGEQREKWRRGSGWTNGKDVQRI